MGETLNYMRKILKKDFVIILSTIMPLIVSEGILTIFGVPDMCIYIIKLIDFVIVMGIFFVTKSKPSKPMCLMTLVYGIIFFSALLHGAFKVTLYNLVGAYTMCLIFDFWLNKRKDLFLQIMTMVLCSLVILNFISIVIFPKGIYETRLYTANWILGYKNSHFPYIMTSMAFFNVVSYKKEQKLTKSVIAYMLMCCLSLYLVDSMAAFVSVVLYVIVMICFVNHSQNKYIGYILKILNVRVCLLCIVAVSAIIIIGSTSHSVINELLTNMLRLIGRNASFTGRDVIWEVSLELIKESPILGYGVISSEHFVQMTEIAAGTHAHNYILNIMIMGGTIALIGHIILYYKTTKLVIERKDYIANALGYIIVFYFLSGITGINFYATLFNPLFILIYYVLDDKQGCVTDREIGQWA